mmetsp:Transcript_63285/g.159602  ORF Transcript_63285/g.159602 Transcript_63285/m.159602 type:complete len:86 (+) Transcript_63285:511-768(+)
MSGGIKLRVRTLLHPLASRRCVKPTRIVLNRFADGRAKARTWLCRFATSMGEGEKGNQSTMRAAAVRAGGSLLAPGLQDKKQSKT